MKQEDVMLAARLLGEIATLGRMIDAVREQQEFTLALMSGHCVTVGAIDIEALLTIKYDKLRQEARLLGVEFAADLKPGDRVTLCDDADAMVPGGDYVVSQVNPDGSFHVGGLTAVWPRRVVGRETV